MSRFEADRVVSRKLREYLGSSKCTLDYMRKMRSSMDRINEREIDGLHAIIIPSGGGKTTAAKNWGFLDIDEVIGSQAVMERLVLERREMIRWGENRWEEHNKEWYAMAHGVLKKYDFSERPGIILVHTEEMAYEIGANPIAALKPSAAMHNSRLSGRNELERMLAVDNLKVVEHRTKSVEIHEYKSWTELDQYLACLTWDIVELAAPFRAFKKAPQNGWPLGYGDNVPFWVMKGELCDQDRIQVIEKLHQEESIPGVCVSYYSERLYGIKQLEMAGCKDTQMWIELCGDLSDYGTMGSVTWAELATGDMNEIYPYESKMASNKRSIGLRRLMENVDALHNDVMKSVLHNRRGSNQNLVVSILVWVGGVMSELRQEVQDAVLASGILLVPDDDWIVALKRVHDLVRTTGEFFGVRLTKQEVQRLLYMHMLYGRFSYEVEEGAEIEKRERDLDGKKMAYKNGEWTTEEYDVLELEGIRDAYRRLCDKVPYSKVNDFVRFWKERRSWLAKGSTVIHTGEKKYIIKFVDQVVKEIELRHNKKSLLEDPNECENVLAEILSGIGRNDTKVVPKFESAAKRALLPGNLYHYVVFSYVLWVFENCGAVGDVRLGVDRDESFHAFDDKLQTGLVRFTYDFSDFNAQHSRRSMARVISLLGETVDPVATLRFCLKWLSISFGKMEIIDRDGVKHPVKSGLYSGWRGTTWINSVLNHAYIYVARVCYWRLTGTEPFAEYEGAGDDVDGVVRNLESAGKLYAITVEMGLESNTMKQLFGKRAEFLRVSYDSGYAGASVCRALGNFISGSWESEGGTVSERMTAAIDNIMTLGRRGLNELMVRVLYRCIIAHMGRIFENKEWVPISPCTLHGRVEDGGFGIPDNDGYTWELAVKAPSPVGWLSYVKTPHQGASEDWASVLEEQVMEKGCRIGDRKRLIDLLARDSYDTKSVADRFGCEINHDEWMKFWQHKSAVVSKIPIETDREDEGLLDGFLEWLNLEETPVLDKLSKLDIIGRYLDVIEKSDGEKISPEEWYGEYYEAHNRVECFTAQRWKPVRCPPVVQSKIALWCKELLAQDRLTVFGSKYVFRIVCNTYAKCFPNEV